MKFPTFVSKILQKTAPIPANEIDDLETKCNVWYANHVADAKLKKDNGENLSFINKAFLMGDEWYVRLGFTMLFFWAVRFIQDLMNPGDDEHPDENDTLPRR